MTLTTKHFPRSTSDTHPTAATSATHYVAQGTRDLRLDLLRGLCVLIMIVDHIAGPSVLRQLVGNASFYVSAAEGFIFISGLLVGVIYAGIAAREGMGAVWRKAAQRSAKLYLLMLVVTASLYAANYAAGLEMPRDGGLAALPGFMWDVATLRETYSTTRILLMYSLLMLAMPAGIWMLRAGRTRLLLAISALLYLGYQAAPQIFGQPMPEMPYFNPAAWQVLFVAAMALGFHRDRVGAYAGQYQRPLLLACGVIFGLFLLLHILVRSQVLVGLVPDQALHYLKVAFTRGPLRPGRLIAVATIFPFFYLLVTCYWQPINRALGRLLRPLGEYSLYGYVMHLPLMALATYIALPSRGTLFGGVLNIVLQIIAVGLVWLMIRTKFIFRFFPH